MVLQLELPLVDVSASLPAPIPASRRVYVNRNLKLASIDWVGFDMDYTLAIYRQEAMDEVSIQATIERLIARGYPPLIRDIAYPTDFAVRGLLIDKRLGNILKMNRFKVVRRAYHGLRELSPVEVRQLYYRRKIRHKSKRYHWIDTLYALSEATAYAAIVDTLDQRGVTVDYERLFDDIRECIDEAHRDGTVPGAILARPDDFLMPDPELAGTLHKLRSAGKRLFVLTNSHWPYTQSLMGRLLDGALPGYPTWQHFFDAVIVAACKPAFFTERRPLFEQRSGQLVEARLPLERGRVYQGGNQRDLQQALDVHGDAVLYVGDHIYGDMLRSKKDSAWRTAMVIQELETEVEAHRTCRTDDLRAAELYHARSELEDQLRHYQQRFKALLKRESNGVTEHERAHIKARISGVRSQLRALNSDTVRLRSRVAARFHPYWGPLLKEGGDLSLFGDQVNLYACVYTSRVSNLLAYSPHQYFRSPHDRMHHEL